MPFRLSSEELKTDIRELRAEMVSKFDALDTKIEQVLSSAHRTQALLEEQRTERRRIMNSFKLILQSQDRVDADLKEIKITLAELAKRKAPLSQ